MQTIEERVKETMEHLPSTIVSQKGLLVTREQILALQWHKANEKPKDDEYKIVCIDDDAPNPQSVCIAFYNADTEEWISESDDAINIDWWMDIPPLPKFKKK